MTHYSSQELSDAHVAIAYHNSTGNWKEIPLRDDSHSLFMRDDGVVIDQSNNDHVVVDNPQSHTMSTQQVAISKGELPPVDWKSIQEIQWTNVIIGAIAIYIGSIAIGFLYGMVGLWGICCLTFYGGFIWQYGIAGIFFNPIYFVIVPLILGTVVFYVLVTLNLVITTPGRIWLTLTGRI